MRGESESDRLRGRESDRVRGTKRGISKIRASFIFSLPNLSLPRKVL